MRFDLYTVVDVVSVLLLPDVEEVPGRGNVRERDGENLFRERLGVILVNIKRHA